MMAERLEDRSLLTPTVSIGDLSVTEGDEFQQNNYDGLHNVAVTLSEPPTADLWVYLDYADGTARSTAPWWDYVGIGPLALKFTPGGTGIQTLVVAAFTRGDVTPEPNETFTVRIASLSDPSLATIADGTGIVTILDDDGPVRPKISIGDVTQYEGNSGTTNFVFNVTLDTPTTVPVTVGYATADVTATAGSDYTSASGSVTFSPGDVLKTITVSVIGDTVDEPPERFDVNLSGATNGDIDDGQGTGSIANDDGGGGSGGGSLPVVTVKAPDPKAAERATASHGGFQPDPGTFQIDVSGTFTSPLLINFSYSGTASGSDYTTAPTGGSVTIPVGGTSATIQVNPTPDQLQEMAETVVLTLTASSNYLIASSGSNSATVTITDNGLMVTRPEDGDNPVDYPFGPECGCQCGLIGGTQAPPMSLPADVSLRHSNDAANPRVSYLVDTTVSPNSNTGSSATPSQELVHLVATDRNGISVLSRDYFYSVTAAPVGQSIRLGLESDVATLPTDIYSFSITATTIYSDGTQSNAESVTIQEPVVNDKFTLPSGTANTVARPDRGFGEGWSLTGLMSLQERPDGIWLETGRDEGVLWFPKNPTTIDFDIPFADFLHTDMEKLTSTYQLTDKYGTKLSFSSAGLLQTETDRNGRITTYAYDSANNNRLTSITDSFGRALTVSYASSGLVSTITDTDNRVFTFDYATGTKRLKGVTAPDPDGTGPQYPIETRFSYDTTGRIVSQTTKENGVQKQNTEFQYNAAGNFTREIHHDVVVIGVEEALGRTPVQASSGIVAGSNSALATSANPAAVMSVSALTTRSVDSNNEEHSVIRDYNGDVVAVHETHDGETITTRYEYDANRLLIKEILPDVAIAGGGIQTLEYHYQYDAHGNRTEAKVMSNGYPGGIGPIASWLYESNFSQVFSTTDAVGNSVASAVWTTGAGANGNTTFRTMPRPAGSTLDYLTGKLLDEYEYFADGTTNAGLVKSITHADPDFGGDPDGSGPLTAGPIARFKQDFTYDSRGNVLTVTDQLPSGNVTRTMTYFVGTNRLKTVTNEAGNVIVDLSSYSPMGLPMTMKQLPATSDERLTAYEYDGMGHVVKQTLPDPDGTGPLTSPVYQWVYDARGRLIQEKLPSVTAINPDGTTSSVTPTTTYTYGFEDQLLKVTDPNGGVTEHAYNGHGMLESVRSPDPDKTATSDGPRNSTITFYEYDARDRMTEKIVADFGAPNTPLSHETYTYDPLGRMLTSKDVLRNATTTDEYFNDGSMKSVTDAEGRKTSYTYNEFGEVKTIQQPQPSATSTDPGPLWQFGYDYLGRLISQKDPLDSLTNPRETKYEYDMRSQPTKVTLPDPDGTGGNPAPVTNYFYTPVGELDKVADQSGRITDYTYDSLSELTRVDLPDPDGAGGNPILSMQYVYDKLGRTTAMIDQRGQTTTNVYDAASRLISTTLPDPDGTAGDTLLGTNAPSPVTTYGYDANGWLRTQEDLAPNSGTLKTNYNHDALGQVVSLVTPQIGSDTGATATTQYVYDALGRMTTMIDPFIQQTITSYNPTLRQVTVTEPDPDGNGPGGGPKSSGVTVSTYDKVGNLVSLKDADNNTTSFGYDKLNRRITETDPFAKVLKWDYDAVGNLTAITDRFDTGRQRVFTYDQLDRVTKETWLATSGNAIHSIHYAYDTAGRLGTVKELRGVQTGTPVTEYTFVRDNLDRVTSVVDTANVAANSQTTNTPPTVPVTFTHHYKTNGDAKDVFTKINNKADFANIYTYDNLGRLNQVVQRQYTAAEQSANGTSGTNTIQRKRVNLAYNRAGEFSKILRSAWIGTGDVEVATTEYGYFNGGGVKGIGSTHDGHSLSAAPPMGPLPSLVSYNWTYDVAGRVDLFTAPEGVFDYGYDHTNQLTSAAFTIASGYTGGTPASEAFDFDANGNRNSQTVGGTTTTTTVDKNRLLNDGTYAYTYDGEGNRVSKTLLVGGSPTGATENYTWDHRNRLTKVEFKPSPTGTPTKIVVNSYDAFDRRVMKQVDANGDTDFLDAGDRTERYVHDGDDLVLVLDGATSAGTVQHRFLHGPAIDQIFSDEDSVNGLMWYLADNQGTVRDVVNNSGTNVNHLTYSPFGKLTSESDPTKTPFVAYTSQDLDEDLGLQLHGKRWFDPNTGRWMSEDPIRFAAGDVNLQRYVFNQPTTHIDPTGLEPITVGTAIVIITTAKGIGDITIGAWLTTKWWECKQRIAHIIQLRLQFLLQHNDIVDAELKLREWIKSSKITEGCEELLSCAGKKFVDGVVWLVIKIPLKHGIKTIKLRLN